MGIGRTNAGGGGASLNFDVKAYATEAELLTATPKENTIGIITEHKITSWIFSAVEPTEPAEGMVWISTGMSSPVEFNALKKNGIQVYPRYVKQYVIDSWKTKNAYIYNNSMWNQFRNTILPNTNIAWTEYVNNSDVQSATATNNADSTVIKTKHRSKTGGGAGTAGMYTQEFDFTDYNTLHVEGSISWDNSDSTNNTIQRIILCDIETITSIGEMFSNQTSGFATGYKTISVDFDISAISKCRIAFTCVTWDGTKYITVTFNITSLYVY